MARRTKSLKTSRPGQFQHREHRSKRGRVFGKISSLLREKLRSGKKLLRRPARKGKREQENYLSKIMK